MNTNSHYENRQKDLWIVRLFHSLPHFNLTFNLIDSTFKPNDVKYQESLLLWAAVPILALVVTLLIFLIYFIYRCCQSSKDDCSKKHSYLPCFKWTLCSLGLFVCAILALTLFANEDSRTGLSRAKSSSNHVDNLLRTMRNDIDKFAREKTFKETCSILKQNLNRETNKPDTVRELKNELAVVENNFSECTSKLENIGKKYNNGQFRKYLFYFDKFQLIRWLVTLSLMCWTIIICIILLLGVGISSKCVLLTFLTLATITIILLYIFIGLQLSYAIGTADFCTKPMFFIKNIFKETDKDDLLHFTEYECHFDAKRFRFANALKDCTHVLYDVEKTFNKYANVYLEKNSKLKSNMDKSLETLNLFLSAIESCLDCRPYKREYDEGMDGICKKNLIATFTILITSTSVVILLSLLILISSKIWKYFNNSAEIEKKTKKGNVMYEELMLYMPRKGYASVDEDDPFLPRDSTSLRNSTDDGASAPIHMSNASTDNSIDLKLSQKFSGDSRATTLPHNSHVCQHNSHHHHHHHDGSLPRSHYTQRI